ncbi:MAG: hypothetical protein K2O12_05660, partial [Muribaculaceae bacterium]|nr:hypothetical protein [Muribaculaceae bacterium]
DAKINDQNIVFKSEAKLNLDPDVTEIDLTASISDFRPDILGLDNHYPGHTLSAELKANTLGRTIEASDGEISIKNISYVDDNGEGLKIQNIAIKLYSSESPRHIDINGDFINGSITGLYEFASLPTNARYIISQYLPALINEPQNVGNDDDTAHNIFDIDINISPCSELCEFLRLPVSVISPVSVSGNFNSFSNTLNLYVDIPFLQQGKQKIFYDTALGLNMNIGRNLDLYATTSFDTKKGPMVIIIDTKGQKNRLDTNIDWKIIRDIPIEGTIDFSTTFHRGYDIDMAAFSLPDKTTDYPLIANIHFNPGKIIFGETVWDIIPSDIIAKTNDITISGFSLMAENEHLNINGRVSHNP